MDDPKRVPLLPYARQDLDETDIEAVVRVLRSDWLTQGPVVPRFEETVAAWCGARHAVAVNSATSALHIACLALGLGPGDRLWTTPNTFAASANCGAYCGAMVDFVDIDPATGNMSIAALRDKLDKGAACGALPKVLVAVHFAGLSCDMPQIQEISRRYGFRIIEDAAHALGGRLLGEPVGCCRHSDVTVFSFHPVKSITTGEGGMALTNDTALAQAIALLRGHGITRAPDLLQANTPGPWYYEQLALGFNYRMTDIQAALGESQFKRLESFIHKRHALAARYDEAFRTLPVSLQQSNRQASSAHHLYVVRVAAEKRSHIFTHMRDNGIGVNVHYLPVHLHPYYRARGFSEGNFPEAERHAAEAISLPLFVGLSYQQQDHVIELLASGLEI